jgi:hypothetical protein
MSLSLASIYRWAVRPFDALRIPKRARGSFARNTAQRENEQASVMPPRLDAERLECIAAYARAGYFNMGYTLDMFHVM